MINQTDIFTEEEQTLLNKGLKYNLSHKNKYWIRKLALEAENSITLLPIEEQDYMRYQVAKQIQRLQVQKLQVMQITKKKTQGRS